MGVECTVLVLVKRVAYSTKCQRLHKMRVTRLDAKSYRWSEVRDRCVPSPAPPHAPPPAPYPPPSPVEQREKKDMSALAKLIGDHKHGTVSLHTFMNHPKNKTYLISLERVTPPSEGGGRPAATPTHACTSGQLLAPQCPAAASLLAAARAPALLVLPRRRPPPAAATHPAVLPGRRPCPLAPHRREETNLIGTPRPPLPNGRVEADILRDGDLLAFILLLVIDKDVVEAAVAGVDAIVLHPQVVVVVRPRRTDAFPERELTDKPPIRELTGRPPIGLG